MTMSEIRHLNLEAVRMAAVPMFEEKEKIKIAKDSLKSETDGFLYQGGWTGPSHDQFIGLWEEWKPRIEATVSDLESLQRRLGEEAHKWERMTEKFGDSSA
jgi:uncharacterized protein YukE